TLQSPGLLEAESAQRHSPYTHGTGPAPPGHAPLSGVGFFESGHDTHVFTLTDVPVAPAACGLRRPGKPPSPAEARPAPPASRHPARVLGQSAPWAAAPDRATPPGSGSSPGERHSPAAGVWHAASAAARGSAP